MSKVILFVRVLPYSNIQNHKKMRLGEQLLPIFCKDLAWFYAKYPQNRNNVVLLGKV